MWLLNTDTLTMGEFITGFLGSLQGAKELYHHCAWQLLPSGDFLDALR